MREILIQAIRMTPAEGEILWSTYYLANKAIIAELKAAAGRGVKVGLALEGKPRNRQINTHALQELSNVPGLELVRIRSRVFAHLHEKLYYFSHPKPFVFVGSYNPSMDPLLDPHLVGDIGDQDSGHNMLVKVISPSEVATVRHHLNFLLGRPALNSNPPEISTVHFFPNRSAPHLRLLSRPWRSITIAMSHIRDGAAVTLLCRQAEQGCKVRMISHSCTRRFPERHEHRLMKANAEVSRYRHPRELPMHSKYILLDDGSQKLSLFGSLNLTRTSRWLNREVMMVSPSILLYEQLQSNWNRIRDEIARGYTY